jgi:hypothetical protein
MAFNLLLFGHPIPVTVSTGSRRRVRLGSTHGEEVSSPNESALSSVDDGCASSRRGC